VIVTIVISVVIVVTVIVIVIVFVIAIIVIIVVVKIIIIDTIVYCVRLFSYQLLYFIFIICLFSSISLTIYFNRYHLIIRSNSAA
jgi:hypothetical protein